MTPLTVSVPLPGRDYDIRIGPGLLKRAGAEVAPLLRRKRVAVLTDARVADGRRSLPIQQMEVAGAQQHLPAGVRRIDLITEAARGALHARWAQHAMRR